MLLLAAALLASSDPVAAATTAQAPDTQPTQVAEKKICKVDENESSSRLRKRVCMTQTEWDRLAAGKTINELKNIGAR